MTYKEALNKIYVGRILGALTLLIGMSYVFISTLKYIYFSFRKIESLNIFASLVQPLVFKIYDSTKFLSFVWDTAPIPDLGEPAKFSNVPFFLLYILMFIGAAILGASNSLARKVKNIESQIEEEQIKESIQGRQTKSVTEIKKTISINESGDDKFINRFSELIIAPIITAIIGAFITKLLGLT